MIRQQSEERAYWTSAYTEVDDAFDSKAGEFCNGLGVGMLIKTAQCDTDMREWSILIRSLLRCR